MGEAGNACGVMNFDTSWKMKDDEGEELWKKMEVKIKEASSGSQSNNIAVLVRVRPFNKREKDLKTYNCIKMQMKDWSNMQCW